MEPVNIAIVGLGTVGAGTLRVLQRNQEEIERRAGRSISIYGACVKDIHKPRDCDLTSVKLYTNPFELAQDPNVDIVIELVGGCTLAKELVLGAITHKKQVVTANKALIAQYGNEIFSVAKAHDVNVAFEAAVAGGIPIIKTIREGLGGNRIDRIAGIINGTCNYILTEMLDKGIDFKTALEGAKAKGYAEADPTADIAGTDSAHKLTILASLAFGMPLGFDKVYVEGIDQLSLIDVQFAHELGYEIKLLGIAKRTDVGVELRVHPTLIPKSCLLAQIKGPMNAVAVHANAVGSTLYYGQGAGGEPTASSVIADVVDVIRSINMPANVRVPYLAFQDNQIKHLSVLTREQFKTAYYLRLMATDEPGILAQVTSVLGKYKISIQSIMQRSPMLSSKSNSKVPVIILTHTVLEGDMKKALEEIQQCYGIEKNVIMIRMENDIVE